MPPVAEFLKPILRPQPNTVAWPQLADGETWGRVFAEGMIPQLVLQQFGFGCLHAGDPNAPVTEYMPVFSLSVAPGGPFDFADPELGFHGWEAGPHPKRVLTLWADDLLTVTHGDKWRLIADGAEPFDRWWVDALFPGEGAVFRPPYAAVMAQFSEIPHARMRASEFAPLPLTIVHVEDRRTS